MNTEKIERLLKLKIVDKYDVLDLEESLLDLTGEKHKICSHCAAQIRFYMNQLSSIYHQKLNQLQTVEIQEPVIKKKPGRPCVKCGKSKTK